MNLFKNSRPQIRRFAAALLAIFMLVPMSALAGKTLKLHHTGRDDPFDNPSGTAALVFKSLVEAGTDGEIRVNIFANSVLGNDSDAIQQVKSGGIQSGIHLHQTTVPLYPPLQALEVPFALQGPVVAAEVFNGPFGEKLAAKMEAATGLKILGFGDPGGFVQLTGAKKELLAPQDLSGLRMAVPLSASPDAHARMLELYGAQPVPMTGHDMFTALQAGDIDGVAAPMSILAMSKAGEAQKYFTVADALFPPTVWAMNKPFWDSLSEREKNIVSNAAHAAILAGQGITRAVEAGEKGLSALQKTMKTKVLDPEERERFRTAALPALRERLHKDIGENASLLDEYLSAIQAAGMVSAE